MHFEDAGNGSPPPVFVFSELLTIFEEVIAFSSMKKHSLASVVYMAPQTDTDSELLLLEFLADSGNTEPIDGGDESDLTW